MIDNQDPIKAAKLYKNLLSDGYTAQNLGSEYEFITALEDGISAEKIYKSLVTDGYNQTNIGSKDEFLTTFVKKKGLTTPGSKSGSKTSGLPSFGFQEFKPSSNQASNSFNFADASNPMLQSEIGKYEVGHQSKSSDFPALQGSAESSPDSTTKFWTDPYEEKTNFDFAKKSNPELIEKVNNDNLNRELKQQSRLKQISQVYDTNQGQGATRQIQSADQSNVVLDQGVALEDRKGSRSSYVYNKLLSGVGELLNSVVDLSANIPITSPEFMQADSKVIETALDKETNRKMLSEYRKNTADQVRNYFKKKAGVAVDPSLENQYDNEFITGAIGGLANSAPAMAMPGPLRGAAMVLQGYDAGVRSVESADENGEVDDLTKTLYGAFVGISTGLLEKYGFDRLLGNGTSAVGKGLADKAIKQAVESGEKVTGESVERFLNSNIKDFIGQYSKRGANVLEGAAIEFGTGGSQEIANIASEYILNAATGKSIFDTEDATLEGVVNNLQRAAYSGAQEAVGGGLIRGVLNPNSAKRFEKNQHKLEAINTDLENPQLSVEAKEVLVQQKIDIQEQLDIDLAKVEDTISKLPEETKVVVEDLNKQIQKIDAVLEDPNVSDEAKSGIVNQRKVLEDELVNTLTGETFIDNIAPISTAQPTSQALDLEALKSESTAKINDAVETTDKLAEQLMEATTPEQVSAIKVQAEAAAEQGIKATQTLDETSRASEGISSNVTHKKGDSVTVIDENGDSTTGLFKEALTGNKIILGINEDGIYKEKTIQLPVQEETGKTTKESVDPSPGKVTEENEPSEFDGKSAEDLAQLYTDEVTSPSISAKESAIANTPFYINRDSYINFGDKNNISSSKARSYFKPQGLGADQIAQEINNNNFDGRDEVTAQDVIDFIDKYPNGNQTVFQPSGNPRLRDINEAYFNVTGKKLNQKTARGIVGKIYKAYKVAHIEQIAEIDKELINFMKESDIALENIDQIEEKLGWIFGNDLEASVVFGHIRNFLTENGRDRGTTNNEREFQQGGGETNSSSGEGDQLGGGTGRIESEGVNSGSNSTVEIEGAEEPNRIDDDQQYIQDRKKNLVGERIKHAVTHKSTKSTKKLNQIIKDVADDLATTMIYAKGGRKNSLGSYDPSNTLIKIRNAGDIETVAHELGHAIDDRFDLLGNKPTGTRLTGRIKDPIDKEIKWYYDRGGSNPPGHLDAPAKRKYLQREGFAEFILAYVSNPKEANSVSPGLYDYFEATIDDKTKDALAKFSKDYIDFANATAGEQVMANIEDLESKGSGIKDWLLSFSKSNRDFRITPLDKLKAHVFDSLTIANKAFDYILDTKALKDIVPEKNFELMSRVFAGVNGKINRILETGLIDGRNEYILSSSGDKMNIKWLFEKLDASSESTLKAEMNDVIQLLVAERTIEYADKFGRADGLTGIGAGIKEDLAVAQDHLKAYSQLKEINPDQFNRIRESADRYREFADAGLKYAVDKGRISEGDYSSIKENNQYYVSLARVKEIAPTEEPLSFINQFARGKLTSVKDVLKKTKGGTGTIQNPYLSLLKNTTDLIREADRNEVIRTFIEPLNENRSMGEGTPVNYSKIARKVSPSEKNAKTVFVKGVRQHWQFQDDIYTSLTEMDGLKTNLLSEIAAAPASLLRSSVTMFPVFFAKNVVRDTQSRIILSRTGSSLKDFVNTAEDKELFELYGGSQAGFHLIDKNSYAEQLGKTIRDLAQSGKGIVLDPRKIGDLWGSYKRFLEKGENLNRIAEFKSAFKKAKNDGFDNYNAGLQAAYEARDLMDFAVAGHTMRIINRYVPFSNAGIQGLRRSAKAINEDPEGFMVRVFLYSIIPQLATRAIVHAMGDDDEYDQLPAYQRDLCYTFRTPATGDLWISIPKPFDIGLFSSLLDRSISKANGNDHAFSGFDNSALKIILPFDEGSIYGGFKPYIEAGMLNKDTFRDADIIPFYELNKPVARRDGTKRASSLGKILSDAIGSVPLIGKDIDPRLIDHVIKGQFSYFGDWAMSTGNLITGNKDSRYQFNANKTGFANENPIGSAQVVKDVYELSKKLGTEKSASMTWIKANIKKYYSTDDVSKRQKIADEIYSTAMKLREAYEQKLKKQQK